MACVSEVTLPSWNKAVDAEVMAMARGVERGGVAGRTGSDDDEVVDHGSGILGPRRGRCRCDWKVVD